MHIESFTEEGDGDADDSLLGILHLDGGDIVDLAAERAPEHGQIPVRDRDPVFADEARREGDAAGRVLVVGDLGGHGLSAWS